MTVRVTTRNARFQQWESLLHNRTKRHRLGEFLVQGVRPISLAIEHGWTVRALVSDGRPRMSAWAAGVWGSTDAERVVMAPELVAELARRTSRRSCSPWWACPPTTSPGWTRPVSPWSSTAPPSPATSAPWPAPPTRSAPPGWSSTGHAADPYDPRAVRASTGSLFALTVVRAPSHREVLDWARPAGVRVVGTDETGAVDVRAADLTGPLVVVVGNETAGMTAAWREACDALVSIPMAGSASSLNAATAGSIVLDEAARQRRGPA